MRYRTRPNPELSPSAWARTEVHHGLRARPPVAPRLGAAKPLEAALARARRSWSRSERRPLSSSARDLAPGPGPSLGPGAVPVPGPSPGPAGPSPGPGAGPASPGAGPGPGLAVTSPRLGE